MQKKEFGIAFYTFPNSFSSTGIKVSKAILPRYQAITFS